ncbi:MAG TPA: DUF72 domain-containing protein [Acidimicrobiia bacterium]|nr:DUF72 domain-containing protein [Acidimicrobiia bacterium]
MGSIAIGTSGWSYRGWKGSFYPDDLPRRRQLDHVTSSFDTVELNRTFYSLASSATCRRWRDAAPPGFLFAVKGSRFITHNKKLADAGTALANFFASGVLELDDHLGPFLWQLPPAQQTDPERLEPFLAALPRDIRSARLLARAHDDRVSDPGFGSADDSMRLRHSIEFRNPASLNRDVVEVLRRHRVALAFSHSTAWPYTEEITADFVYLRLHGPEALYDSGYGEEALKGWVERILAWSRGDEPEDAHRITDWPPPPAGSRDVFVYFDNDGHAHAPHDALALRRLVHEARQNSI